MVCLMSEIISGSFGEHGDPQISFFLRGTRHDHPGLQYTGLVDTGFTGFIQISFLEAFRLQLPLAGLAETMLADGSTTPTLTALGLASLTDKVDDEPKLGTIHLSASNETLIGMEFLRAFEKGLGIFKDSVILIPDPPPPDC